MLPPLATFCLVARSRGGILFAPTEAATATCVEIETCRVRYYGSARCRHRSQVLVCQALAAWPHLAGGAVREGCRDLLGLRAQLWTGYLGVSRCLRRHALERPKRVLAFLKSRVPFLLPPDLADGVIVIAPAGLFAARCAGAGW